MLARRIPDTRFVLVLVILAFLAATAWWWSLRAGRVDANLSPTPGTGATPGSSGAAGQAGTAGTGR